MHLEPNGVNMTDRGDVRPQRRYRGDSPDERTKRRRERLLEAAVSVYGEVGFAGATVQDVCDAAGLTKRYFYESFENSEALLAACLRRVSAELMSDLAADPDVRRACEDNRARAILAAYFCQIRADPKPARLFLFETEGLGSPIIAAMREAQDALAEFILQDGDVARSASSGRKVLQSAGAMAGVARISAMWIATDYGPSIEDVIEASLNLFAGLLPLPSTSLLIGG